MFAQELTIAIKTNFDKDKLIEEFQTLLGYYWKSGQLQIGNDDFYCAGNFLKCNVKTLEKDSLHKKHNTAWVTKQLHKLEKLTDSKLEVKTVGTTYKNYAGACTCKSHAFLIVYTHVFNHAGPLDCGTCFKPIPLYRLTTLSQKIRQDILRWEQHYKACDRLQIDCTVGEKWATKQMMSISSELSKEGIEIGSRIEALTHIPTFYYLFNYRKVSLSKDKKRTCPSCGKQWLLKNSLAQLYDFKCDRCRLISSITSNGTR